jgi:dTDP-4-dehydrorhamnose reductase
MIDHAFVDNQFAGTYHVASPHGITKFGLLQLQSRLLNISKDEVDDRAEGADDPKAANPSAAPRPQCTQLNCDDTWAALGKTFEFAPLEEAMGRATQGFPKRFLDGT